MRCKCHLCQAWICFHLSLNILKFSFENLQGSMPSLAKEEAIYVFLAYFYTFFAENLLQWGSEIFLTKLKMKVY